VMYVKGACLDPDSAYPQLVRCPRVSTNELDPDHGTGISVNRWLSNVNWIGVPGKHLFYNGEVLPWQTLTEEEVEHAARRAIDLGVFRGVEFGEYPTTHPEGRSLDDFVRTQSLGTDFALRFGRTLFCARLPLEPGQVDAMIAFLNEQNRLYAEGEASYHWSGYSDNCVHLTHNAFAAARVWKPKRVGAIKIRQFFHLAIPANEFIDLADRTLLFPIEDFGKVWRDETQREALREYGWLSTRHGAMVMTLPVHQDNTLYDTHVRIMIVQGPLRDRATKKANALLGDARATQIPSNLRFFKARYDAILDHRAREEDELFPNLPGYDRDRALYYAYIERQAAEVDRLLAIVAERTREYLRKRFPPGVALPESHR
jgi:hypothetical protein